MTSNQFHDVATLCIAALAGKLSITLAQVTTGHEQDWLDRIIGPTGALVCMGIAIWYLASKSKSQEAKADAKEAERIERDDGHIQQRETMIVQLTEAVTATKNAVEETRKVVEKNTVVMEKTTDALKNHKCI